MKTLLVYGRASQKEIKTIQLNSNNLNLNLMELLINNEIPVASSCNGEGACMKCILTVNGEKVLSCQVDVLDILKDNNSVTVLISYL